jgi:hypothetical protein
VLRVWSGTAKVANIDHAFLNFLSGLPSIARVCVWVSVGCYSGVPTMALHMYAACEDISLIVTAPGEHGEREVCFVTWTCARSREARRVTIDKDEKVRDGQTTSFLWCNDTVHIVRTVFKTPGLPHCARCVSTTSVYGYRVQVRCCWLNSVLSRTLGW